MPAQRLAMRQIKEVLRLKWAGGLSDRQIAQSLSVSRPTVAEYVRRAQVAGLSWPLPETLDDTALERLLFPAAPAPPPGARLVPDWSAVHRELECKGVTLVCSGRNKATTPGASSTVGFVRHIGLAGTRDLVMRQHHRAGEKLLVDYAGQSIPVVNSHSGEVQEAAIFIAVLGASSYTYADGRGPGVSRTGSVHRSAPWPPSGGAPDRGARQPQSGRARHIGMNPS